MKRYARDKTPNIKPVQRIELSDKHLKLRIILTVVFLIIAAAAIGFGVKSCLSADKGWQEITSSNASNSLSVMFKLFYNIGESNTNATSEKKSVQYIYTAAAQEAYTLYDNYAPEGYMKKINTNLNGEGVEVDPELYAALQKMLQHGRILYYVPYFEYYEQVFSAESDFDASVFDPAVNDDIKERFAGLSAFINDENSVRLELLGDNRVSLHVSDEYKAFATDNGVDNYIGFGWLENAFAADHISDRLKAGGHTNGYLTSVDGFTEYMNGRGFDYTAILYDRAGSTLVSACSLRMAGAQSSVYLKNYLISTKENGYIYEDGRIVTVFFDKNGEQKTASNTMFVYSKSTGCADAALKAVPIYTADEIDEAKLSDLKGDGIYAVVVRDKTMLYTEENLVISDVAEGYGTQRVMTGE